MKDAPSSSESKRLAALRQYGILDTLAEQSFDDLALLAAQICETPAALISLVDEKRQWFKARVGISIRETPREYSFCAHAIRQRAVFTVRNAAEDERFSSNPFVTAEPRLCFYAGAPLMTADGEAIGTICVVDSVPRELSPGQLEALQALSRQAMKQLELRLTLRELEKTVAERERAERSLRASEERFDLVVRGSAAGIWDWNVVTQEVYYSARYNGLLGHDANGSYSHVLESFDKALHPEDRDRAWQAVAAHLEKRVPYNVEYRMGTKSGEYRWFNANGQAVWDGAGKPVRMVGSITDISERKQTENALRESNEKFQQMAANITDVFWIRSPDMREVHYVSPAFEQIWGRPAESVYANPQTWADFILPEDRARVLDVFAALTRDAPSLDVEYRILRPDGQIRWVRVRGFQVRDATGKLIRHTGIVTDITEQRRVEEELRKSEEQYRGVFASVTDGLIIFEQDGTIVEGNPAICRMLGYTRDEFVRLKPGVFIHPDSLPLFRSFLETVREAQPFHCEGQTIRKDGTIMPVEVRGTLFHYHGRPHLLAVVQDTTERRQAEEALRKSEAEFRVTFEHAGIGMALVDPDGRPLKSNRTLQQLLGYSQEELQGMAFREFTHPDDAAADLALYRETLAGKREHYQIEKRYLRKGGEVVHARLTVSVVRDPTGQAQYAIGMVEDITEKKKLETQFLRAQRMESIGTLAGGIAHDLNNVLAPILMSCDLLRPEARDEESRKLLGMIKGSAERGAELVKQVLSFARGVEGRRAAVQPKYLICELVNIAREIFPKSIVIRSHVSKDLWMLSGDTTQLHQVLLNLCVNARDAMPAGGELTIAAENVRLETGLGDMDQEAKPGPHIVIKVSDTGTGISPEIRERIFDPFFTTKEAGKGTGLGLSTSLGIVKSHGGFIHVQSVPGKGSTFEVWLPAKTAGEPSSLQVEEAQIVRGRGELVLVVDDEASVRAITRQILEANGYSVLTAVNGTEAAAVYSQRKDEIKVILTDMMMPVMDGYALLSALLKMNPAARVIATSGLSNTEQLTKVASAGAKHFVPKPCSAERLLRSLYEILHGQQGSDSVPILTRSVYD
jgi:PAS domain S-box-containing protein